MGYLQIKDPSSPVKQPKPTDMTPPPAGSPGSPRAVDRLTTFFLSKFQEAKKDSDLSTLQCTTQLKFDATEKTLKEHAQTIAGLRQDIQSFWDKAPSFFLHKFSAQLDALGAGRSEKSEQALSRLERRVDDEVRNLGDQLSDVSTKLAVSTAALNAAVDDIGKKISTGSEASAESLRRCENEFSSKIARLESLVESTQTEAAIERGKINKTFQEASRRLQSKVDSLEHTVLRQSEELTSQCDKIDRLEKELQKLSQLNVGQDKAHSNTLRILSVQAEDLARLSTQSLRPKTPSRPSPRIVHYMSPKTHLSSSRLEPVSSPALPWQRIASRAVAPEALEYENNSLQHPVQAPEAPAVQALGETFNSQNVQQKGRARSAKKPKRSHNESENVSLEVKPPPSAAPEPPPKRQRTAKKRATPDKAKSSSSATATAGETRPKGPQQVEEVGTSQHGVQVSKTKRPLSKSSPHVKSTKTASEIPRAEVGLQPTSTEAKEDEGESSSSSRLPVQPQRRQRPSKSTPKQKQAQQPPMQDAGVQEPASAHETETEDEHHQGKASAKTTPDTKADGDSAHEPNRLNRREAAMAFINHVRTFAFEFKTSPPRSERQFIWRFLEEIPDRAWSEYLQRKLLEAYPEAVRPSLGIRAKHPINFDSGLSWRHVLELIRRLQQRPGAA